MTHAFNPRSLWVQGHPSLQSKKNIKKKKRKERKRKKERKKKDKERKNMVSEREWKLNLEEMF